MSAVSSAERLQCSICLELFSAPVTTPCGHSFCRTCINQHWDHRKDISCPVCKQDFSTRPQMNVNTVLDEMVFAERNKPQVENSSTPMLQPQFPAPGHVSSAMSAPAGGVGFVNMAAPAGGVGFVNMAAPSGGVGFVNMAAPAGVVFVNVNCDVCLDLRAVKSCSLCMKSYCDSHLQPHFTSRWLSWHPLVEPHPYLETQRKTRKIALVVVIVVILIFVLFIIIHSAMMFRI